MARNLILLFIGFILVMGLASAEIDKIPPAKQNECINLPQIEINSTYQNLTFILLPDKEIIRIGQYMNKSGYSYYYDFCNTSQLGVYTANGCSDQSCWNYEFEVTRSGNNQTTSQGINSAAFLFMMLGLAVVFGFVGYKLYSHENLWVLGLLGMFIGLLLLVYITWLGVMYSSVYLGNDSNSNISQFFFFIFLLSLVAGFFMAIVIVLRDWKDIMKSIKKAITGKDPDSDGWDGFDGSSNIK